MEQKEVYIVQSSHTCDTITEAILMIGAPNILENAIGEFKTSIRIITDVVRAQEITQFFCDGYSNRNRIDRLNAFLDGKNNLLLETLVEEMFYEVDDATEKEIREIYTQLGIKTIKKRAKGIVEAYKLPHKPGITFIRGYRDLLAGLLSCNLAGVAVRVYETEDTTLIADAHLYDTKSLLSKKEIDDDKESDKWIRQRDYAIYKNIKGNASQRNILFMGSAHELSDFYKPNSGFKVAAVTITQEGPQYRYANRDGVPDFFREIVERRYAEMRAGTN